MKRSLYCTAETAAQPSAYCKLLSRTVRGRAIGRYIEELCQYSQGPTTRIRVIIEWLLAVTWSDIDDQEVQESKIKMLDLAAVKKTQIFEAFDS